MAIFPYRLYNLSYPTNGIFFICYHVGFCILSMNFSCVPQILDLLPLILTQRPQLPLKICILFFYHSSVRAVVLVAARSVKRPYALQVHV